MGKGERDSTEAKQKEGTEKNTHSTRENPSGKESEREKRGNYGERKFCEERERERKVETEHESYENVK